MRRSSTASLALAALLAGLLGVGPAQAAVATPYTPAFGSGIDRYASYEPENTCSPTAKPGTLAFRDLLVRTYGTRWNNISRACSASDSGHEEGRSLDWQTLASDPTQKAQGDALLTWLLATDSHGNTNAMARRLGIQYIQFNNRMWRAYDASKGWQPQLMSGKSCATLGSSYVTTCHRDHIHFSFSWAGANEKTSWFTGSVPCPTPVDPPAFTAALPTNLTAVPITPVRLLDTRSGAAACRLAPKGRLNVKVTGVGSVPSTGVGAVAINVTGVRASGSTYLSVYPAGTTWGGTSSVNLAAGSTAVSLVTVPVGSSGMVTVRNSASPVDVLVDVVGYFTTASTGSRYVPVTEQRMLDTRLSTIMAAGERRTVTVAGRYGVPIGATGVLVNVTSTGSTSGGFVTVAQAIGSRVGSSTVNYVSGVSVANRAMTALSGTGTLEIYTSSQTHVLVDLVGWFGTSSSGLRYNPVTPARILDTRNSSGGIGPLVAGSVAAIPVAGHGGIPSGAVSVVGTLTITAPTATTYSTIWRQDRAQPATYDINLVAGTTRANLVAPALSASGGKAALTVGAGSAAAVLDVLGYFSP